VDSATRPAPTTLAFHASRIVIDVGVLVVLGAMSLPFVTAAGGDRSSIEMDALPVLLLVGPIFLVTMIPDHTRPLHRVVGWVALVLGLAALPYALVKYLDSGLVSDSLDGKVGLGAYLLVLGAFITVVGIVIGLVRDLMGLPTGGTPGRRTAVTTKRPRTRATRAKAEGARPAVGKDRPVPEPATAGPRRTQPAEGVPTGDPAAGATVPMEVPSEQESDAGDEGSRRPRRALPDVNPFPDPLFDSLEIPATRSVEDAEETRGVLFHQGEASERFVDEDAEDQED
jgi:hypothetical protein